VIDFTDPLIAGALAVSIVFGFALIAKFIAWVIEPPDRW